MTATVIHGREWIERVDGLNSSMYGAYHSTLDRVGMACTFRNMHEDKNVNWRQEDGHCRWRS